MLFLLFVLSNSRRRGRRRQEQRCRQRGWSRAGDHKGVDLGNVLSVFESRKYTPTGEVGLCTGEVTELAANGGGTDAGTETEMGIEGGGSVN